MVIHGNMNKSYLKIYLWNRFYEDNHPKYLKYFEKWYNNLTNNQIFYFNIDYEKSKKNIL